MLNCQTNQVVTFRAAGKTRAVAITFGSVRIDFAFLVEETEDGYEGRKFVM